MEYQRRLFILISLLVLFGIVLTACTNKFQKPNASFSSERIGCTQMGCSQGIYIIVIRDNSVGKINLEIISEDKVIDSAEFPPCTARCQTGGVFEVFPDTLTIRITNQDNQILYENSDIPQYLVYQPNGPKCEPICREVRYEIDLTNPNL